MVSHLRELKMALMQCSHCRNEPKTVWPYFLADGSPFLNRPNHPAHPKQQRIALIGDITR